MTAVGASGQALPRRTALVRRRLTRQVAGAGLESTSLTCAPRASASRAAGLASGPVSFVRATDAWAATIRTGGRARRGAKMVVLDASHLDILEFIEAKAREELVASLSLQHANRSLRVTDEFLRVAVRAATGRWRP